VVVASNSVILRGPRRGASCAKRVVFEERRTSGKATSRVSISDRQRREPDGRSFANKLFIERPAQRVYIPQESMGTL